MDFLIKHRKICSAVAALMVAVLVVYCYGSFRSYAAAPEVSTLPADDIGAEVAYDADSITLNYNGDTYVFNRHMSFDELISDLESVDELDSSLLYKVQHVKGSGYLYWYVSSNNRYKVDFESGCYLERPSRDGSSYVSPVSYWLSPSHNCVYILYDDVYGNRSSIIVRSYSNGSFYYVLNPDSSLSPYWFDNNSLCYDLSTRSFNFNVAHYPDYIGCFMTDSSRSAGSIGGYPTDLVCIFSNYEISGFYEIDTSKVNTPSYYFKFQYIFYKEGFGYIFVDSAKRVREVGFPNNVNNPRFYFDSECNSYVYTSKDGISWSLLSTVSNMYAKWFEVSCNYAFTDYTLIYTNDSSFGNPLVTPDYGSISDITDNLKDIVNDKPLSGRLVSLFTDMNLSDLLLRGVIADGFDIWVDSSDNSTHIGPRGGAPDDPHVVQSVKSYPSISMYLYNLVNTELNIDTKISALRIDLHADLKSIFDNITLSNQYLKRISDNLDSLSIPAALDYSGDFDKLSAALDKLHNDLIYEEGVTKLPNVPQYLVYIYGVTKDIRTRLDTIIDKMPSGSGSVDVDTDSIVTAINESATSLTATVDSGNDKLHSDLNYIKALMTIDTVNKLFGDDNDSQNIFNFVSKGIASIVSGSIISDALAFSTNTKDGIIYISSYVNKFYDAVPVYSSIVTVGASFFIIDMVLRRKS